MQSLRIREERDGAGHERREGPPTETKRQRDARAYIELMRVESGGLCAKRQMARAVPQPYSAELREPVRVGGARRGELGRIARGSRVRLAMACN
jgi:hypothetical protein